MVKTTLSIVLATLFLTACSSDSSDTSTQVPPSVDMFDIAMNFERVPSTGLDPFKVTAIITNNTSPVTDAVITPALSSGSASPVVNNNNGNYTFTVTPDKTGEYNVTIYYADVNLSKTALVVQDVHAGWGQPESVSGLVNTAGYEDGVTITPDGEYLFVQTGPFRMSSIFIYGMPRVNGGCGGERLVPDRCEHPWINETIGTLSAPQRPGFFTGRFSGTTQLHNAASWGLGIDETPNYALSTMFYGFKKQEDGSFKEPFHMAFSDLNDAISSPFGLSFMDNGDGSYTTIFAFKDSYTTNYGFDIYTYNAIFGLDNNFGDYELSDFGPGNPPKRGGHFPSALLDLGDNNGTQGNPFLYYSNSSVKSIWTDDEYDSDADAKKLSVYVLNSGSFPTSSDWVKIVLPSKINVDGTEAIQPTFVDAGLYFTQDVSITFSAYLGEHNASELANNNNWTSAETILQKDTTIGSLIVTEEDIGKVMAIGEPTIAVVNGKEVLYFVYAYIRGIDPITKIADLDFQAGFVEKN